MVAAAEPVVVTGEPPRFVGRGGEKLAAALDRFGIEPAGRRALDAGASTGGFTDCLLQRGAARVVAVDVGHGQLHARLRADPRVLCCERTDVRSVSLATVGGQPVDLVVADLSFISATLAVPALVGGAVASGADIVLLVKPQFEAGRAEASRGRGVIRDPAVHRRTVGEVAGALEVAGAVIMGAMPSPLTGQAGNVEFLLHARAPAAESAPDPARTRALLDAAVADAHGDPAVTDAPGDPAVAVAPRDPAVTGPSGGSEACGR